MSAIVLATAVRTGGGKVSRFPCFYGKSWQADFALFRQQTDNLELPVCWIAGGTDWLENAGIRDLIAPKAWLT